VSVEYFGPDGFQSLRPEHFLSPGASKTSILYRKWLLETEGGKGTNVLFGDGRVVCVTAEELDRLKATDMPASDENDVKENGADSEACVQAKGGCVVPKYRYIHSALRLDSV